MTIKLNKKSTRLFVGLMGLGSVVIGDHYLSAVEVPTTTPSTAAMPTTAPTLVVGKENVQPDGLKITLTQASLGARVGDTVMVLYTGKLPTGEIFDSSALHNNVPIPVKLGAKSVIAGWEEGLVGASVGEKRLLTIPPSLGYGSQARGEKIPANSTLVFEIEVVGITRG